MNKIPALRSYVRFDSPLWKNSCRLLAIKAENAATRPPENAENVVAAAIAEEVSGTAPPSPAPMMETSPVAESKPMTAPIRYNVCPPRKPLVSALNLREHIATQNQSTVRANITEQNLQPNMLKEYYQNPADRNVLVNPKGEETEEFKVGNGGRKFQHSKTYVNAILPLKSVKLASPFPDPVKSMMSDTVSDSEKAQQALAESRGAQKFCGFGAPSSRIPSRTYFSAARRFYSSKTVGRDDKKCKKLGTNKKGCPKMTIKGCPAPYRVKCDREPKKINCKKQLAPYPAYSEFCHEEPDEKPSECKICPWKTEENPNFKPPKHSFHTTTSVFRSDLDASDFPNNHQQPEGMLCDLRKGPCERPKNRVCPPPKQEKKKPKPKPKKPKKKCANLLAEEEVAPIEEQFTLTLPSIMELKKEKPKGKGDCRDDPIPPWRLPPPPPTKPCKTPKFPFVGKCEYPKRRGEEARCPPKKKKKRIEDCPGCGKCTVSGVLTGIESYQFSKKDTVKKDKSKCPKVDMTVNKQDEDDDPCNLKRKGTTKICPGDLLVRKRRKPRKPVQKHSEILPPAPKMEPPQPSTRIM